MDAAPPAGGFTNNATSISTASWWKTTSGGASPWPKQGLPQSWAGTSNVHVWTGDGTGNGAAWAYNAKLSLAALGTALGLAGPLTGPFFMWYQIDVETPATTARYSWPAGSTVAFDSTTTTCTPANPCAVLPVNSWGMVNPTATANCPSGSRSTRHASAPCPSRQAGSPRRTRVVRHGSPGNDFVAELTNTDGVEPPHGGIDPGALPDRQLAVDNRRRRDLEQFVTTGTATVAAYGSDAVATGEVRLPCVNPPFTTTSNRLLPAAGRRSVQPGHRRRAVADERIRRPFRS